MLSLAPVCKKKRTHPQCVTPSAGSPFSLQPAEGGGEGDDKKGKQSVKIKRDFGSEIQSKKVQEHAKMLKK